MQRVSMIGQIRSIREAMVTYRDTVDELERSNWSGNLADSIRRIAALQRIAAARTTHELERLAGLPEEP